MSFKIKLAVLALTAAFSSAAFSAEAMLGTGGYNRQLQKMEMMKMLDANGDHMVTAAEADAYYNSMFDALNKDNDDSLDANEWVGTNGKTKIDIATGGYSRELRSMKMMKAMDTDGDHKVTREEFLNFHRAVFAHKDTTGDEQISAQEWAANLLSK